MVISIEKYITSNNPKEASLFLEKFKVPRAKNPDDMSRKINWILKKYQDTAVAELAKIKTPYQQLIKYVVTNNGENTSSCDGSGSPCTSCKCKQTTSSADGAEIPAANSEKPMQQTTKPPVFIKQEDVEEKTINTKKESGNDKLGLYLGLTALAGIALGVIISGSKKPIIIK